MKKYRIKNTSLFHNGKARGAGEIIELTDVQAAKLADYVDFVSETGTAAENAEKIETNTETAKTSAKQTKSSSKTKTAAKTKNETNAEEKAETIAAVPAEEIEGGINGAEIV